MNVLIVGGGKTGARLAEALLAENHSVRLIEGRAEVLSRLAGELPAEIIVPGDGSSPAILEKGGVKTANVLVAVTGEDEANLVVCTLARFEFNVPRIIARVNNPKNAWLFTPEMGVDVALNQTEILTRLIEEEMSLGDMMTLLELRKGEFVVVEEKVHPDSAAVGKCIADLDIPEECVIAAILRKGKLLIPHGDTALEVADEVIALVHSTQVNKLAETLSRFSSF